jgi:DNA-binding NarL/FixJ family response regulator
MAVRNDPNASPALQGARLLVAEDDPLILMDLEYTLEDAGAYIVGSCQTVKAALALCASESITAAILDIRLGRETIAPVVRELVRRGIPFVFYSGQTESDPICDEWPDCRLVPKPSAPHIIVTAIADLVRH